MLPNTQVGFQVKKRENSFSCVKFLFWKLESYVNCEILRSEALSVKFLSPLRGNYLRLLEITDIRSNLPFQNVCKNWYSIRSHITEDGIVQVTIPLPT